MSKHTPGPYLCDNTTVYALNEHGTNRVHISVNGGFVEQPRSHHLKNVRTPEAEVKATAQFLALAANCHDEMLEALNEAAGFIDSHSEEWYRPGQELLAKVRAAIAKAEGSS